MSKRGKAAGQHGLCDHCVWYKLELKKFQTSASRVELMDKYSKHLLQNWRDRQFDSSLHAQSCQTRESLLAGTPLSSMSHSVPGRNCELFFRLKIFFVPCFIGHWALACPLFLSCLKVLLMRSDGLDQAKHLVPRALIQAKTFSELIRPACHVMMNWCHGYSFHFAVSDADFYKDPCLK